ncbi:hypothetical protein FRC08_009715, partial [Ceratobasidium sp. 394]
PQTSPTRGSHLPPRPRAPPIRTASVPTTRPSTSAAPIPAPRLINPLPTAPEAYSHSRNGSVSRPSQSRPPSAGAYHAAKWDRRRSNTRALASSRPRSTPMLLAGTLAFDPDPSPDFDLSAPTLALTPTPSPTMSVPATRPQSGFARPSLCSTLTSTSPSPAATLSPSTSTTKTSPAPSRSHAAVSPYPCLRPLSGPCPPSVLCSPTTSASLAPHSHSRRCPCVPTPACTLVLDPDPNLGLGTNHDYAHPRALSLALELPPLLPSQ